MTTRTGTIEQNPLVEWHTAARAYGGEVVSGDLDVVAPFPGGVLAAASDGLGHGPDAAAAANAAAAVLLQSPGETVTNLMAQCHEALRRTRGAVISLVSFNAATAIVTWLGVGNVAGVLLRRATHAQTARETLLLRGGVVGHRLPPLRPASLPIERGDVLVLATDGIGSDFAHDLTPDGSVVQIAVGILLDHGRATDDAQVLVVRWIGMPP